MNEPIHKTLHDLADFLQQNQVSFAVIGGIATTIRGHIRSTDDLDVVAWIDVDECKALLGRLDESPFRPLFEGVEEVVEKSFLLPLRHEETNIKVDLALGLSGFEQQAIQRATAEDVSGRPIPVVTAEDLILMKTMAGRARDVEDVTRLVALCGDELDWEYLLATAEQLEKTIDQDIVAPVRRLRGPG